MKGRNKEKEKQTEVIGLIVYNIFWYNVFMTAYQILIPNKKKCINLRFNVNINNKP